MLSTILLFCLLFLLKCKRQVNCFYVAFLWESDVALVWQNQYCVRKIDSTWTLSKGKHNWIEKRNSLTNCQLLTYLKAQHHFTAICWPLSVFFHVIQLEVLAFIAVWSTISFPKPNVLDERGTGGSVLEFSPATREARVRFPASAKQSPKETFLCLLLSNWLKPLDDISWIRFCWEARVSECSGNGCLKFGSETSEFLTNGKVQRTLGYFVVWWGVIVKD